MTINLIMRNVARHNCLLKSACINASSEYLKIISSCSCPTILTLNLTSKCYSTDQNKKPKRINKFYEVCRRFLSADSGPPSTKLPPLMNFPEIVWPSLFKSFRNFILATFIIKPYMDREFNLPDFVRGSKKALEVVSSKLSEGDIKSLNGLVAGDVVPSLQNSISRMSLAQREQLSINGDDIYFSFPYQVGIIFNDDEEEGKDHKRFVEITMVYHTLRGLSSMRSRGEEPPLNMGMLPEFRTRISICNYRFIREFTKGVESDWTINLLNHFKPADLAEQ